MSLEEGLKLLDMCLAELKKRFIINMSTFSVKVVDKDGIRVLRGAGVDDEQKPDGA